MADRTYYATKDFKHPIYRTRMMRAGDELTLGYPLGPLYEKLGAVTADKQKKVATAPPSTPSFVPNTSEDREAPKRAPRKRAAKKAKS
jgi:hypothetical protein